MDAELAEAGGEAEEGKAEDAGEQSHRSVWDAGCGVSGGGELRYRRDSASRTVVRGAAVVDGRKRKVVNRRKYWTHALAELQNPRRIVSCAPLTFSIN